MNFKVSIDFYINCVHNYYVNVHFKHVKDILILRVHLMSMFTIYME